MTPERDGFYGDPAIYDILYGPDTHRELDVLERIERKQSGEALRRDRLWLEPACGSGRYLRVAAGRGRLTAGFDLDPAMLAYAAARRLRPGSTPTNYFVADMADFSAAALGAGLICGSVDLAFQPVNSIRHLRRDHDLVRHLDQVAELLRPGAPYIIGISLTDYSAALEEEDLWSSTRGSCRVSQLVNYLPPEAGTPFERFERVLSHLTIQRPTHTEHRDHAYELRTYDRDQWQSVIHRSQLQWAGTYDAYGNLAPERTLPYQHEVLIRPRV